MSSKQIFESDEARGTTHNKKTEPKIIYLDYSHEDMHPLYPFGLDKGEYIAAIALRGWNVVATSIHARELNVEEFARIPNDASIYAINDFMEEHEEKLLEAARQVHKRENFKIISDWSMIDALDIYEKATNKLAEICEELQNAADAHNWERPHPGRRANPRPWRRTMARPMCRKAESEITPAPPVGRNAGPEVRPQRLELDRREA